MANKIRVGIIFGGKSVEHEVSIQSARNIFEALDKEKYEPVLIGIDKNGHWHLSTDQHLLSAKENTTYALPSLSAMSTVALVPTQSKEHLIELSQGNIQFGLDVIFPVLHGPNGEDGTIQGLLKLMDIPFVGPSVLGSAVCMDKDIMKRILRDAGIPVADFVTVFIHQQNKIDFDAIVERLGLPFFVKPANAGSSVGISKVKGKEDFEAALNDAFRYDRKVLCEKYIKGREIEFSVLGNEHPMVSGPGEIIPTHEFYSYEAKYLDENGAILKIPADINEISALQMQECAIRAFEVLSCEGMARCDFFLQEDGKFFLNELNTIPGFTKISMYPKLWEASGINYSDLIDKLILFAVQRHEREKKVVTSFSDVLTKEIKIEAC